MSKTWIHQSLYETYKTILQKKYCNIEGKYHKLNLSMCYKQVNILHNKLLH